MKAFFIIILIMIIGAAAWFWLFDRDGINVSVNTNTPTPTGTGSTTTPRVTGSPTVSPTATTVPGTGGGEDINFSRTGTLLRNTAGLKANTWYLSYRIAPSTYTAELVFPPDSTCVMGGVTRLCSAVDLNTLSSGSSVRVQGFFESNVVEVTKLEMLGSASPTTSPNVSPTTSPSPTVSPTISPTISPTSSPSPTTSPTISPTMTVSPSPTVSPTTSPTVSPSPTSSPTPLITYNN